MEIPKINDLLDLSHTLAAPLFDGCRYPWEVLPKIKNFIIELSKTLPADEYYSPSDGVFISKTATIAPSASITGPCIIGPGAEIRHCAFIRGSALIGAGAVVGNSTELKNCILFDCVQVPHYNYVGDSVLGYRSHMGAGSVTSNVKSDKTNITVLVEDERLETGLRKFGAILGDFAEIGCGTVLNPGSVIGRTTNVYPQSVVRGFVPSNCIYKSADKIVTKIERN
jgi:NDP-sugar pyrophosphorylase family protein